MVAVGVGGILLAGVAAPPANAGPLPDQEGCFVSGDEPPAPGAPEPGEGFLMVWAGDEPEDGVCSYTASGIPINYRITGLSAWTLTFTSGETTVEIDSREDLLNAPDGRLVVGTFTPEPGDLITLTAKAGCAPDTEQCGTLLVGTVGSDPAL
jgi:hypothetical protein